MRLLAAASVATAMSAGVDGAHAMDISWYNGGPLTFGVSYNCSYFENRMSAYVGYGLRPGGRTPAVGEVWYAHLVISHPGADCAHGGSPTDIHFVPPPNTDLAAGEQIYCFWRRHDNWIYNPAIGSWESWGTLLDMANACNQSPPWDPTKGYSLHHVNPVGFWDIPQYSWMEFIIPLRSTATEGALNNLYARLNPELNVVAYPAVSAVVNNNVIFRDGFDPTWVYLDICGLAHTNGC